MPNTVLTIDDLQRQPMYAVSCASFFPEQQENGDWKFFLDLRCPHCQSLFANYVLVIGQKVWPSYSDFVLLCADTAQQCCNQVVRVRLFYPWTPLDIRQQPGEAIRELPVTPPAPHVEAKLSAWNRKAAQGLCSLCGKVAPAAGRKTCEPCRVKTNQRRYQKVQPHVVSATTETATSSQPNT